MYGQSFQDIHGGSQQPFSSSAKVHVLLFVRTDCPLVNRYAPELQRLASEFQGRSVEFWLVYGGASEQKSKIARQVSDFHLPGIALLDPEQQLARRAEATVSPQIAVFDGGGGLTYSGRIDDRFVGFGKARPYPQTHDAEAAIRATLEGKPIAHSRTQAVGCYLADLK